MLKNEWSLLVSMTLETPGIRACRKSRLLEFKTAVGIVTITAFDLSFEDLVMKRPAELRLSLAMTTDAELRLTPAQHVCREQIMIASFCFRYECV